MRSPHIRDAPGDVVRGFDAIRAEAKIPDGFPADVEAEATRAAQTTHLDGRTDRRHLEFVTIDPPGSRDLDQALHVAPHEAGWTLHYAVADVGAFVLRGGAVEKEAWARGETVYLPDRRSLLYPECLSQGAASLLPDQDRPCVLFTIEVSRDGEIGDASVERAVVRSRARLAYADVGPSTVPGLRELGTALAAAGTRRGATQVDLPDVEIEPDPSAPSGYRLAARERAPSEDWNAQLSLAANMVAARMMMSARTGLYRVMDTPDPARLAGLRAAAIALGFTVPDAPDLAALGAASGPPAAVGALRRAARSGSGAGYRPYDDAHPPFHSAVAAPYAHATAPMRRLADRYVLDLLVELNAGHAPTHIEVFAPLADAMNAADSRAGRAEAAAIDLVEAFLMAPLIGHTFRAVVTGSHEAGARIQLIEPPVRATVPTPRPLAAGTTVSVTLTEADPQTRRLGFRVATV